MSLGAWEYARVWNHHEIQPLAKWVPIAFSLFVAVFLFAQTPYLPLSPRGLNLFVLLGVFALVLHAFYHIQLQGIFPWISYHIFGFVLLGYGCGQGLNLIRWENGIHAILPFYATILCMSAADTGGYFAGKTWGKHKLAPSLSPKKTIEGLLGGCLACIVLTALAFPLLPSMGLFERMGLGLTLSLSAPVGDLFFSALKRWAGIKDYSQLIPGHGGILDRFDSLFFSLPLAYLYINP